MKLPEYQGGNQKSTKYYHCGTYLKQYEEDDRKLCKLQSVLGSFEEEMDTYVQQLILDGYQLESDRRIENNRFFRMVRGVQKVALNYFGATKKATIILDEFEEGVTALEASDKSYVAKGDGKTAYYMFGLKMDPHGFNIASEENKSGYINAGQCLVIKCADNSVIIIDGGIDSQMEEDDQARFIRFLREITQNEEEVISVSAWFISHFHSDHMTGMSRLLEDHPKVFAVKRILCNMPSEETFSHVTLRKDAWQRAHQAALKLCPDAQEVKLHTGDVLQIADVRLTFLCTHEDMATLEGSTEITDFNDTSTVFMAENGQGVRMLVTGDINLLAEKTLSENYTSDTLACDILQGPHHNFNDISILLDLAKGTRDHIPVIYFTQTLRGLVRMEGVNEHGTHMLDRFAKARPYAKRFYCGGDETVGLRMEDDVLRLVYEKRDIYTI